ncbi:MAG: hypothetical protein AAGC56_06790 [Pseudomonadota bacterium]
MRAGKEAQARQLSAGFDLVAYQLTGGSREFGTVEIATFDAGGVDRLCRSGVFWLRNANLSALGDFD